jgi:hypothetical protein
MSVSVKLPIGETVTSEDPVIAADDGLPAGRYLVQLIVETEAGVQSQPVRLRLVIGEPA